MHRNMPVKLSPAFKDYLWGGEKLRTDYHKNTTLSPLAESWELSAHKDGESTVSGGRYDVCVANIVADIIIRMMPDIDKYMNEGAPVILSGIIETRAEEVEKVVSECGYTVVRREKENDWVAMMIRKA